MLNRVQPDKPRDYFLNLSNRAVKGAYFCRLNGYSEEIRGFLREYYEAARVNGVIIEGRLQNPDNGNIAYYNEIMGPAFVCDAAFIANALRKWLPRMTELQRGNVAGVIYDTLSALKRAGKNDNMLKNAYIKFMCWLYYKFERIISKLGEDSLPKIIYDGAVGQYELLLLSVINKAGCDILLVQYSGDAGYKTIDPSDTYSSELRAGALTRFPEGFSLKTIQNDIREAINNERLYGARPKQTNCTNAWLTGNIYEDIRLSPEARGTDERFYYNMFVRVRGVEDRLTYTSELFKLQADLKSSGRGVLILNAPWEVPSPEEISMIRRKNCKTLDALIMDLSSNLLIGKGEETQRRLIKAFVDLMLEEGKKEGANLNRITSKAVYLLSWLRRWGQQLFGGKSDACVLMMGGCSNENEALFLRFLSRMNVDIIVFVPNLNAGCALEDPVLFEVKHPNSLALDRYPEDNSGVLAGTSAYHAERDLDTMMYGDSGLYRDMQYARANVLVLQTMREEIDILWDNELRFRPNFAAEDGAVTIPVLFAKICGVKDGNTDEYWSGIKKLLTPETGLITSVPHIQSTDENELKPFAADFLKNGRLQKRAIKANKHYKFGFLRESMQDYLLDTVQAVIDRRLIAGTFVNGTEYTIVSTALNLDIATLRQLQSFDFTKKNPKLVYVITGETALSLEDTIHAVLLNQLGFDVLFFVPTGYRCIEKYYAGSAITEHQAGQPVYDMQVPDFSQIKAKSDKAGFWQRLINRR